LEFTQGKLVEIQELEVPCCRKLIRLKGNAQTVQDKILLLEDEGLQFPAWVEIQIETERYDHDLEDKLNKLIAGKPFIERLFIRQNRIRPVMNLDEQAMEAMSLTDLNPLSVFTKRCDTEFPDGNYEELLQTFGEALELMNQKEEA
jgi:exonuclease SbcD